MPIAATPEEKEQLIATAKAIGKFLAACIHAGIQDQPALIESPARELVDEIEKTVIMIDKA